MVLGSRTCFSRSIVSVHRSDIDELVEIIICVGDLAIELNFSSSCGDAHDLRFQGK